MSFSQFLKSLCFVLSAVSVLVSMPSADAQVTSADIVGTITDSSGGFLASVTVVVQNRLTGVTRSVHADSSGNYVVTLLPVGRYAVKAELTGFKTWSVPEVVLAVSDRLRLDIRMEVGEVNQSVEVNAEPPALQAESSSVGSLVNERAAQDLPLNGRNFIRLAQIAEGATEGPPQSQSSGALPGDRRQTSTVSVNSQRDYVNNFLIDGMDNNERFIGTTIVKPAMDAVAEFRVQTNLYSAEIGRAAGGVINLVTKSGSNYLHGSQFEFFRNEKLDAKNYFAGPGPTPLYRLNQFGGSIGGPIRKNHTFFFGDYEGFRLNQGLTYTSTVPTVAMRTGNFAGINPIFDPLSVRPDPANPGGVIRDRFAGDQIPLNRLDTVATKLLGLYPVPQTSGLVNNFIINPPKTQRNDTFDTRADNQFSEKDSFFARYSFNDTNTYLPPQLPALNGTQAGGAALGFAGSTLQRSQGLQLNHVHTFRPNLLLELKAGYSRFALRSLPVNYGKNVDDQFGIPGANFDADSSGLTPMVIAGFQGIGDSDFIPYIGINNIFQYTGSLTYIRSGHSIKVGAELKRRQVTPFQSPYSRGQFTFDSNFTNDPSGTVARSGNALASFLLGLPSQTIRSKYLIYPGLRVTELGTYIQDDWRATHKLTFNIGVRYDVFGAPTEVANRISNVNLATGTIIIAGQNGVSSSAGVTTDWRDMAPRFGFAATLTPRTVLRGGYGISYYPTAAGSNIALRNPPFVSLLTIVTTPITPINKLSDGFPPPSPVDPNNPTGSLSGVELNLKSSYVQQYNLTLQREVATRWVWTASYVGSLSRRQVFAPNVDLALPGPGAIGPRRQYAGLFPNVSGISETGSWGNGEYSGLQTSLEHRFKSGLSLLTHYTWSHAIDNNQGVNGGKPGNGPFPQLVNNWSIERGNSDLDLRHRWVLMADYELPFGKLYSGLPGVLAKGWQINAIALRQSGLPLTVSNAAPRANTGGGDRPNTIANGNLSASQQGITHWFNTAAFIAQPLYQIGNTGRNTLYGPPLRNLDLSIFKNFRVTERLTLQFRAEAFNLTNSPNFGLPAGTLGTANFGVISDTGNALPRNLQFALKVLF